MLKTSYLLIQAFKLISLSALKLFHYQVNRIRAHVRASCTNLLLFPSTIQREKKKSVKLLEVRKQVICWNVRASPGQDMGEKASSAHCCLLTLPEHMRLFHSYPSCIYRLLRFCTHSAPEEEPTNINGLRQKQLTGPIFKQLISVLLI